MESELNYYSILELGDCKDTSHEDISNAFRRLSVLHHPLKNQDRLAVSQIEFSKLCEAYDVLSNPDHKA